jgi:dolichol-phosphate mannosyltransferase
MKPRVSIIVPAYQEGPAITQTLDRLLAVVSIPSEILVVYDTPDDSTAPHVAAYAANDSRVVPTLNMFGRGPAHAIAFGMKHGSADVLVVTMADASDDVSQIPKLVELVEAGSVIAAGSRYSRGGSQIGGPRLKGLLSRLAGLSLHHLAGVTTRDATNSFKAYSAAFVREVEIESTAGFEVGIELVAKAHRLGRKISEIPTVWRDRTEGTSNFQVRKWLPKYLHWYFFAFGKRLTPGQLSLRAKASS